MSKRDTLYLCCAECELRQTKSEIPVFVELFHKSMVQQSCLERQNRKQWAKFWRYVFKMIKIPECQMYSDVSFGLNLHGQHKSIVKFSLLYEMNAAPRNASSAGPRNATWQRGGQRDAAVCFNRLVCCSLRKFKPWATGITACGQQEVSPWRGVKHFDVSVLFCRGWLTFNKSRFLSLKDPPDCRPPFSLVYADSVIPPKNSLSSGNPPSVYPIHTHKHILISDGSSTWDY